MPMSAKAKYRRVDALEQSKSNMRRTYIRQLDKWEARKKSKGRRKVRPLMFSEQMPGRKINAFGLKSMHGAVSCERLAQK